MTGDKVEKDTMVFGYLTDLQMAWKVRMLMRSDLDHEAVCVGARDRIMYLSQQIESIRAKLAEAEKPLDVDWLSNVIRSVDGNHSLGADALAEKIVEAIANESKTCSE